MRDELSMITQDVDELDTQHDMLDNEFEREISKRQVQVEELHDHDM
jgi:hypothetical protein